MSRPVRTSKATRYVTEKLKKSKPSNDKPSTNADYYSVRKDS